MSGLEDFYVHTVHVRTYRGDGALGPVWDEAPTAVRGFLDEAHQLVRDATGDEVTASSTLRCSTVDGARFTPESKVTLHRGTPLERDATVIAAALHTSGALGLPDHAEISFT